MTRLRLTIAYFLFLMVGVCVFYNINGIFMELPILIAHPVPEGKAIASQMTFAAQSGNLILICYLLWPWNKDPNLNAAALAVATLCVAVSFGTGFFWQVTVGGHSIVLLCMCAAAGSLGSLGNLFLWPWAAHYHVTLTSALSAGMGLSAVISSVVALGQNPGKNSNFGIRVFYLIAAAQNFLALAAVIVLVFTSLGQRMLRRPSTAPPSVMASPRTGRSRRNTERKPLLPSSAATARSRPQPIPGINGTSDSKARAVGRSMPSVAAGAQDSDSSRRRTRSFLDAMSPPQATASLMADQLKKMPAPRSVREPDYDSDDEVADFRPLHDLSGPHKSHWREARVYGTNRVIKEMIGDHKPCRVRRGLLVTRLLIMACLGCLIYGWFPGLLPYLVPAGLDIVIFQAVGQVCGVAGRIVAGVGFPRGTEVVAFVVNILSFTAMCLTAAFCDQHTTWYMPTMCVLSAVFGACHGISSTVIMMRCSDLVLVAKKPAFHPSMSINSKPATWNVSIDGSRDTSIEGFESENEDDIALTALNTEYLVSRLETKLAASLGAMGSIGSGLGGVCVYFAVKYWIDPVAQ